MKIVLEHISSYMVTRVNLSKGTREEMHLFDFESFREAWVNACVHNAWRAMIPPSVLMFDDRIEVVSYGTVPFPLSLEGFYNGDSRPVNRSLFELFTILNLTEQSGHGVPTIVSKYGREAFDISDNGVVVTIPYAFEPDYVLARKENGLNSSKLDEASIQVIRCLKQNPTVRLLEVSETTGLSLSSVKKIISKLKAEGFLINEGTNRNSLWVLKI
jgi:predicted HTH transcriptional regulator